MNNILLATDVYKMGHMEQYPPGTTKIYSYLQARSDKKYKETQWYGLQYYLKLLEKPVTMEMALEFIEMRKSILGFHSPEVSKKVMNLAALGYWPLKIKAVPEGTSVPVKNVLMTMTNTHPDFYWCVGFVESLLLKVWNTCTVASYSKKLKDLCQKFSDLTCDNNGHLPFQVHDFGYRGCSSDETAALSGSAHLVNFLGTDTVPAIKLVKETYGCNYPIGLSVPATEHSVMCAYGQASEFEAFKRMLEIYPSGIVSIVSDTYNLWNVLTDYAEKLKDQILSRDGKVVFRPDSGDPEKIICGNEHGKALHADDLRPTQGALRLLWDKFGGTTNSKGYKVLNPKVGLIYGDGMYFERFERILTKMKEMGFASSNLVVGIGGLLLQQHNRDDQGFAIKATYGEINGKGMEIMKDPITDPGKKSHKGLMALFNHYGQLYTQDKCIPEEENTGELQTVFENGKLINSTNFNEIRARAQVL